MKQPHILCSNEDITEYVLLPGDPQRTLRTAAYLDEWQEIAYNREFRSIKGLYKGAPVTIVSTGIGGASAVIALEELITCGGKYFIRIGSGGAVQPGIHIGDLIIPTAAVREDGASRMYVGENYPAVADFALTHAILETCNVLKFPHFTGIVRSHDGFYMDEEDEKMSYWNKKGVLASDMETAALFTVSQLRGVKTASILNNVVLYQGNIREGIQAYVEEGKGAEAGEKREILLALETIRRLYRDQQE
ncbi:nucleoside phosphorylase [Geosporobacter ferrireducens]|uniref:Uridine phosphorylase n=1 Tax=Geosporobacter ferrireducens TaxID=1424294 RepID=A0A1D8GFU9_9FIRM|nr:nucleoside phosphorylase [Geosporobacter ferrireducens]AOT69760.1 uridine phosphorylase [Geosporobacter ferrireducens]MTI54529.1 nucleoside phosphorylase [Geosporobacter ferrireducens]